jgi:hypothetical protein
MCRFKDHARFGALVITPQLNSSFMGLTRAFKCAVDPCLADFNRKRPDRPQHPRALVIESPEPSGCDPLVTACCYAITASLTKTCGQAAAW